MRGSGDGGEGEVGKGAECEGEGEGGEGRQTPARDEREKRRKCGEGLERGGGG